MATRELVITRLQCTSVHIDLPTFKSKLVYDADKSTHIYKIYLNTTTLLTLEPIKASYNRPKGLRI